MMSVARRFIRSAAGFAAALLMAGSLSGCQSATDGPVAKVSVPSAGNSGYQGTWLDTPMLLPQASLTDTSGADFDLRTGSDKPVLVVFFGYTSCPDICIGIMTDLASAMNRLDAEVRDQIQVMMITVDPDRDTPEVMRAYLDRIDPSFIGLTGSLTTITEIGSYLGVSIEGTVPAAGGGYEVNHSTQVLGFDAERNGRLVWTQGTSVGTFRADLERFVQYS